MSYVTHCRRGWLAGLGDEIRRVALNPQQEKVLRLVVDGLADSRGVARAMSISTAHAGNILAALVAKGYLKRADVGDISGGRLYVYAVYPSIMPSGRRGTYPSGVP